MWIEIIIIIFCSLALLYLGAIGGVALYLRNEVRKADKKLNHANKIRKR